MSKAKKTLSLEQSTINLIQKIAKAEKRTESSVVDIAVQRLGALQKVAEN